MSVNWFFGPASVRSHKIGVVGNNWLVGNAVFSETALRIFLIFCIKLGDYKGRKVTEPNFWKKILIWRLMSSCFLAIRRSSQCIVVSKKNNRSQQKKKWQQRVKVNQIQYYTPVRRYFIFIASIKQKVEKYPTKAHCGLCKPCWNLVTYLKPIFSQIENKIHLRCNWLISTWW